MISKLTVATTKYTNTPDIMNEITAPTGPAVDIVAPEMRNSPVLE